MQLAAWRADQLGQPGLDVKMNILQCDSKRKFTSLDLVSDMVETCQDGVALGLIEQANRREHAGMCYGARNVVSVQPLVEPDRSVNLLHQWCRAAFEVAAPKTDTAWWRGGFVAFGHGWSQGKGGIMRPRLFIWLTLLALAPQSAHAFNIALSEPKPAPAISFFDGDGDVRTLEDYRGKVLVLNLWATWCAPCRREMPALDHLQAELGDEGLLVMPLAMDRGETNLIKQFYADVGLPALGIYHDPRASAGRAFGALGLPTTIVIDRNGQEVARLLGPADWDSDEAITLVRTVLAE